MYFYRQNEIPTSPEDQNIHGENRPHNYLSWIGPQRPGQDYNINDAISICFPESNNLINI
jgi:hypothetical protein